MVGRMHFGADAWEARLAEGTAARDAALEELAETQRDLLEATAGVRSLKLRLRETVNLTDADAKAVADEWLESAEGWDNGGDAGEYSENADLNRRTAHCIRRLLERADRLAAGPAVLPLTPEALAEWAHAHGLLWIAEVAEEWGEWLAEAEAREIVLEWLWSEQIAVEEYEGEWGAHVSRPGRASPPLNEWIAALSKAAGVNLELLQDDEPRWVDVDLELDPQGDIAAVSVAPPERTCSSCSHDGTCESARRRNCEPDGTRREWDPLTMNQMQERKLGPWAEKPEAEKEEPHFWDARDYTGQIAMSSRDRAIGE